MLNRRRFVYGILSVGAVGSGWLTRVHAAQTTNLPRLNGRLGRDVFLALRQQSFTAVMDHRRVPLVLMTVTDDGCCPDREQFSVLFRAPRDLRFEDGVCVLSHPTAGTATLYLQAAGADDHGRRYRAAFNLLS